MGVLAFNAQPVPMSFPLSIICHLAQTIGPNARINGKLSFGASFFRSAIPGHLK
jgi:hypothetical protein